MLATLTLLASATESRQSKTGENWPLGQTDYVDPVEAVINYL
jgi:hypothetical protein